MKKALAVVIALTTFGSLFVNAFTFIKCDPENWHHKGKEPAPAKYESFEKGVPNTWVLLGKGKLSTSPWHYKLGKHSLKWDFKSGDIIKINNTIGDPRLRGLSNNANYASFGLSIYSKKAMPQKSLRIEFLVDGKKTSSFRIPLNFKGWQTAIKAYRIIKKVSPETNGILIKAPTGVEGTILIDAVVYNSPRYAMFTNIIPRRKPWRDNAPDYKKFPIPEKVGDADKKAVQMIKKYTDHISPKIVDGAKQNKYYVKAIKEFKELGIVEDDHGIRGYPILVRRLCGFYTYAGIPRKEIKTFFNIQQGLLLNISGAAKTGVSKEQFQVLSKMTVTLWKYFIDQGWNCSRGKGIGRNSLMLSIFLFRKALFDAGLMDELLQFYLMNSQNSLYGTKAGYNISMDHFSAIPKIYYAVFMVSEDIRKQVQVLQEITARLSAEILENRADGFKPDGSSYHHASFNFSYSQTAIGAISEFIYIAHNTSFAFSAAAYERMKKAVLGASFFTNNCELPIFMHGARLLYRGICWHTARTLIPSLRYLALASPYGAYDKELAQAYVNLKKSKWMKHYDPIFENKYGIKFTGPPQGNLSIPYARLMAHRRKDWLAITERGASPCGMGIDRRGSYNIYTYHMENGPLSILGKKGFYGSGSDEFGWDWNRTSGATVLYMPDLIEKKYIHYMKKIKGKEVLYALKHKKIYGSKHDPIIKNGDGGISWRGINGCYRVMFRGDHFCNDFGGFKSYFFINDRIYALGSNISSDNKKYSVQTNLYQKALYETKKVGKKYVQIEKTNTPTFVDGRKITEFPVADKMLDPQKPHHLIDTQGNGYFVPKGQKVFFARKKQKGASTVVFKKIEHTGDFATAWLDHGIACKKAKYSYVIMPYCDKTKFSKFSSKDFEILQQDDFAHILHDKIDGFYGGVFFKGGNVTKLPAVRNVERECLIMYRKKAGKFELAIGDPDPHREWTNKFHYGAFGGIGKLVPLKVVFAGRWKLLKTVDGVKILKTDNNETTVEIGCIYGKTFNFTLVKK